MRQVSASIEYIKEEIQNNKRFNAGIHNKEISFPTCSTNGSIKELSDIQKKAIENDRKQFFGEK